MAGAREATGETMMAERSKDHTSIIVYHIGVVTVACVLICCCTGKHSYVLCA